MHKNYKKELADARERYFQPQIIKADPFDAILPFVTQIDSLIIEVFGAHLGLDCSRVCLVALGGYGRMELCPQSDIDLLLLHEDDNRTEDIASLVRSLWDMGFPLGCVVRSVAHCRKIMGEDLATDTALLESRFLAGDKHVYKKLVYTVIAPFFSRKKRWFIDEMRATFVDGLYNSGTSLYAVEPNLKNGICTLRDCQRLIWAQRVRTNRFMPIAHGVHFELDTSGKLADAYQLLLTIRCALHLISRRRIDILEFAFQNSIAEFLGYGEQGTGYLIEDFFRSVRDIRQHILIYLEQSRKGSLINQFRGYLSAVTVSQNIKLLDGILFPSGPLPPPGENRAEWILSTYWLSLNYRASLSVECENLVRSVSADLTPVELSQLRVSDSFIRLLSAKVPVGKVIRSMHDTGFLEKLIPEFEALRCKVEYDSYHEFTVDQHVIIALNIMETLSNEHENDLGAACATADDLFTLRFSVLLHDIGKALIGEHAYTGSVITENICDRLGISEKARSRIVFLVRNHLLISKLAFQRMSEEHVIREAAEKIGTTETLAMLYLLTVADIRSVGRKTWTAWKGVLLHSVYKSVRTVLMGNNDGFAKIATPIVWDSNTIQNQMLTQLSSPGDLKVHCEHFLGFERLTLCGFDRAHFFADIVGCISSEGFNILSAQAMTTPDAKALDFFHVESDMSTQITVNQRIVNIEKKWIKISSGVCTADDFLTERTRLYPPRKQRDPGIRQYQVLFDNSISQEYTVIEIRVPDKFGLLYHISHCLAQFGINIISAKLVTKIVSVVDVFYVSGSNGGKITDEAKQEKIRKLLLNFFVQDT